MGPLRVSSNVKLRKKRVLVLWFFSINYLRKKPERVVWLFSINLTFAKKKQEHFSLSSNVKGSATPSVQRQREHYTRARARSKRIRPVNQTRHLEHTYCITPYIH